MPDLETIPAFARRSGWSRGACETAIRRLGITLEPLPCRLWHHSRPPQYKRKGLTPDDARRLLVALVEGPERVRGKWGAGGHPAACLDCATTERPHHCRGLCQRCESRRRQRASK